MNKYRFRSILSACAEDKGFYIILMLCVFAIGISGYVLYFLPGEADDEVYDISMQDMPSSGEAEVGQKQEMPNANITFEDREEVPKDEKVSPEPSSEEKTEAKTEEGRGEAAETWIFKRSPKYAFPVSGTEIRAFSPDKLLYDDTMGDWRTHLGTDLSCAVGDSVSSVADGTVDEVKEDPLLGTVITVSHEGGLVSRYCGLDPELSVMAGDKVVMGQQIGKVGKTNKCESKMESHLHFEIKKDGKYIDPMSLKYE